ncbi:MAG: GldG family protein [Treponema sp.]|nr:GldG family protein [Treponema sp.]
MYKTAFKQFLFHSVIYALQRPVFFIVAVIYNVICALYYIIGTGFFSGSGSTNLRFFFAAIPYVSILLIPVISSGTDDFCFTDIFPLSDVEHTVISFLTLLVQLCIINITQLMLPACVSMFGDIDAGQVFTGFFLIIIYEACIISFCLLANFLFSRLVSFAVSAIFITLTNFLQLAVSFRKLSFSYHFDAASKGIFDTRDVVFYICLTFFFLLTAVFVQEKKRGRKFTKENKETFFLILLVIIFAFLDSTRYFCRIDLTRDNQFTISKYSNQLLSQTDDPLKITYFRSPSLIKLYPQVRDIYDFLDEYASTNKNVSLRLLDPDKEKVSGLLNNYGIQSQQIQTGEINKTEYLNVYSAVVLEYEGKNQIIPFIISESTLEYDLDRCVNILLTGKKMSVTVLCGNGKNTCSDYSYVIPWFSSQGITCTEINIQNISKTLAEADTDTVLIVFGSSKLDDDGSAAIESFILRGGKVLFAVSPYVADVSGDWSITKENNSALLKMLASYGFSFTPKIVADISCARITMTSNTDEKGNYSDSSHSEQINYPLWISLLPQKEERQGMTLFWPSPLTIENESIEPLLVSSISAWAIDEDNSSQSKLFETNPFIVRNLQTDKNKKQFILGAYFDGKITGYFTPQESVKTKIAVVGDQYFADSLMMEYAGGNSGDYRNLDFLTHMVLKLNGEEGLESLQNKNASSTTLYKFSDMVTFRIMMIKMCILLFILIPLIYTTVYIISIFHRKKKNEKLRRRLFNEKK